MGHQESERQPPAEAEAQLRRLLATARRFTRPGSREISPREILLALARISPRAVAEAAAAAGLDANRVWLVAGEWSDGYDRDKLPGAVELTPAARAALVSALSRNSVTRLPRLLADELLRSHRGAADAADPTNAFLRTLQLI
jgi:hypothetical protein